MGQRQDVISQFQAPVNGHNRESTPMVMLISLKSGAVGLNLTAASNVFLVRPDHLLLIPLADRSKCDPWWQSAIEAQAIDRVHRVSLPFVRRRCAC